MRDQLDFVGNESTPAQPWENDPIVQNDKPWEADPEASPSDVLATYDRKRDADREAKDFEREYGKGYLGQIRAGWQQGVHALGALADRVLAPIESYVTGQEPDNITGSLAPEDRHRMSQGLEETAADVAGRNQLNEDIARGTRSAAGSMAQMAGAAALAPGSMPAMIGLQAATTAEGSYSEARQQGLSQFDAIAYGAVQGGIEGGLTALFNKFAPGVEGIMVGRQAIGSGIRDALKIAGKSAGGELREEIAVSLAQQIPTKLFGLDPNATDPQKLYEVVRDTAIATLLMGGAANAPGVAAGAAQDAGRAINRALQWKNEKSQRGFADFDEAMKRGAAVGERIPGETLPPLPPETQADPVAPPDAATRRDTPQGPPVNYDELAQTAQEEERKLYTEFYSSPEAAYWWAQQNPEAAAKIAESKTYRPSDFTAADPDLPEFDGEGTAPVRKQWRDWVRDFVQNNRGAMIDEAAQNEGTTTLKGWQRVPEGTQVPDHPALEIQETPTGTFVRLKPGFGSKTDAVSEIPPVTSESPSASDLPPPGPTPPVPQLPEPGTPPIASPQTGTGATPPGVPDQNTPRLTDAPAPKKSIGKKKTVRLYRAEPSPGSSQPVSEWLKDTPEYKQTMQASGRWFTDDRDEAQWYIDNEYPGGTISYIDVPADEVEKYRVSNMQDKGGKDVSENPRPFSRRPEKEFFLPADLAAKKKSEQPSAPPAGEPGRTPVETPVTETSSNGKETDAQGQAQAGQQGQALLGSDSGEPAPGETPGAGLPNYGTIDKPDTISLSQHFQAELRKGKRYATIKEAREEAGKLLGGKIKIDSPSAKRVDEAIELGIVRSVRETVRRAPLLRKRARAVYDELVDLYDRQPILGTRNSTSIKEQAYSTPAPLAYLAAKLADVKPSDRVYDSSAGNAMLLASVVDPKNAVANEINPDRAANIASLGIEVTTEDATQFRPSQKVDKVIINPPFGTQKDADGTTKTWTIDGFETNQIDHAIVMNTLKSMKPDGKAVLIIGSKGLNVKDETDRAESYIRGGKKFFDKLYADYNVTDHFTVVGPLYKKQGASFPIDVIVIDGVGKSARPLPYNVLGGGLPTIYKSWEELGDAKLKKTLGTTGTTGPGSADQTGDVGTDLGTVPQPAGEPVDGGPTGVLGGSPGADRGDGGDPGQRSDEPRADGSNPEAPGDAGGQPSDVPNEDRGSGTGEFDGDVGGNLDAGGVADGEQTGLGEIDLTGADLTQDQIREAMLWQQGLGPKPTWIEKYRKGGKPKKKLGEKKPRATKPKEPKAEAPKTTGEKIKDVDARIGDIWKRLAERNRGKLNSGIDPEDMVLAVELASLYVQKGYYEFKKFVEEGVKQVGRETIIALGPTLEKAWTDYRALDKRLSPTSSISDMLSVPETSPEVKPVTDNDGNEFQVPNKPRSKGSSVETLVPRNHAQAYERALDSVEAKYGDIDEFVARELGMTVDKTFYKRFSAEQIDALALAIANHKDGTGFIIGDQTGVGKGRFVAAMLVYAKRNGMVPVFVTEKASLFGDMMRDLTAIGANENQSFNPLITNDTTSAGKITLFDSDGNIVRELSESAATATANLGQAIQNFRENGEFAAESGDGKSAKKVAYDAVFTTYSQLATKDGNETDRRIVFSGLRDVGFFVLDESHTAGGTEGMGQQTSPNGQQRAPNTAQYVRSLISQAPGVMFSSATFAKRYQVMSLYTRAGIRGAPGSTHSIADIMDAGGVPLQQVVSEMLAEAGAYMRREKSFDGIKFDTAEVKVDLKIADDAAEIFKRISWFSDAKEAAVERIRKEQVSQGGGIGQNQSAGQAGVSSIGFSSIMHNIIDQVLVSIKAEAVAEQAIASWKRGEQVSIAVDNTMEGLLYDWLAKNPSKDGDEIDYDFSNAMQRYLDKVRTITIKPDRSNKDLDYEHYLTDEELGPLALQSYNSTKALVDQFKSWKVTGSPIDIIRSKLTEAGMRVREVTGRERVVEYKDGKAYLASRPKGELGTKGKIATVAAVNRGEVDALILNRSGAVGLSVHASKDNPPAGQKPRHMIIAQPAKNIDEFMQMLGRINRTGQVVVPSYSLLLSNIPAEIRPASVLLKKLSSLSANVTGKSKSIVSFDAPDIINEVGDEIVARYVGIDNPTLNEALGWPIEVNKSGAVSADSQNEAARKVTGRMAMLTTAEQKQFWDDVSQLFEQKIEELDSLGQNPLTAKTLELDARVIERTPVTQGSDQSSNPFDHPAYLEKVDAKTQGRSFTSAEVRERIAATIGQGEGDLGARGYDWASQFHDKLTNEMRDYVAGRLAQAKSDADRDRMRTAFNEQFNRVNSAVLTYYPGTVVKVKMIGGDLLGVVTGIRRTQRGAGKNPMAPSTIAFDIAVADGMRKITQPASAITSQGSIIARDESGLSTDEAIQAFDEAQNVSREERYIVTGNLLAGFDVFQGARGQIVFFSGQDGSTRRGILLPKNFDTTTWDAQRPVVFESPKAVFDYVRESGENLYSPDKNVWVSYDGRLTISTVGSKSQGGRYFLDQKLLNAAGSQFNGNRTVQRMNVPTGKELATLVRLLEITPLTTTQKKDIAQRLVDKHHGDRKPISDAMSVIAPPSDAVAEVRRGGSVEFDNGAVLRKSRIDGKSVFEVENVTPDIAKELASVGVTAKKYGVKTRYVIQLDDESQVINDVLDVMRGEVRRGSPDRQTVNREAKESGDESREAIAAADILKTWERMFNIKIKVGGFRDPKNAAAIYKFLPEIIRAREPHLVNLAVGSHEIAHHLDKMSRLPGKGQFIIVRQYLEGLKDDDPIKREFASLDYEPRGRVSEGWAEFIRHYVTEQDADRIAPNAYKWFNEFWSPRNKELRGKLDEAQEHAKKFADQSLFQRVRSAIGNPGQDIDFGERFKARMLERGNRLARDWYDRFIALSKATEEAKKRGYDNSRKADPYSLIMALDMTSRARAEFAIEQGVVSIRDGHVFGQSLEAIKKTFRNEVEYDEASAYAWARHTVFMAEKRPQYNTGFPGGLEGARSWIDYVNGQPDKAKRYESFARQLAQFNDDLINMLVDAGALSQEDADKMIKEYDGQNYFPLHRATDQQTLGGGGARLVNLPKAVLGRSNKGSSRPILDPLDATIARAVHFYQRAGKARVMHSLAEMLDPSRGGVEGMGGLMDRIDPDMKAQSGSVEEILSTLVKEGFVEPDDAQAWRIAKRIRSGEAISGANLKFFANRHGLEEKPSQADLKWAAEQEPDLTAQIRLWREDLTPSQAKATVIIPDAFGNPVMYQLDRFLYDTVAGMDEIQHSAWTKIFRESARWMKTGATGINTQFGIRNVIRDYIEFQGKSEVVGTDTFAKPGKMLGRYIAHKAMGKDDALVREFEEMGGKLFSQLGSDMKTRQRYRRKLLGLQGGSIGDKANAVLETAQDWIAASDVPPRLTAMEQSLKNDGFEVRDNKGKSQFFNTQTNRFVDRLPEYARIRAINAAAESTINFKRMGRVGRVVNQYSTFFNATIQGTARDLRALKRLKTLGMKDASEAERIRALRYLVYLSSMAAVGVAVAIARSDDEDYIEEDDSVKRDFWTFPLGFGYKLTIPKPRGDGQLVANVAEFAAAAALQPQEGKVASKEAGDAFLENLVGRVPGVGGGLGRGIVETYIANYDYFRERKIEPDYILDKSKPFRETEYTSWLAKMIGRYTGQLPLIATSPAQLDHLLGSATGGAYRRSVRLGEAVADGKVNLATLPFISGIVSDRVGAQSINDFYTHAEKMRAQVNYNRDVGQPDENLSAELRRLEDYKELMTRIRATEPRDDRNRRTFDFQSVLVGLAREALGRPRLESFAGPFDAEAPAEVRQVLTEYATTKARSAILSSGYPEKAREGQTYAETVTAWKAAQKENEQWLKDHKDSEIVKGAIQDLRKSQSFMDLLSRRGRPSWNPGKETYQEHQQETQRWMDRVNNAVKWLGDPL